MSGFYRHDSTKIEGPDAVKEWAQAFGRPIEERTVWKTALWNGVYVSTVWLGLDHQFGDGPPLIFETMVFHSSRKYDPEERYSTEAEAVAGHRRLVWLYRFDVLAPIIDWWRSRR